MSLLPPENHVRPFPYTLISLATKKRVQCTDFVKTYIYSIQFNLFLFQ